MQFLLLVAHGPLLTFESSDWHIMNVMNVSPCPFQTLSRGCCPDGCEINPMSMWNHLSALSGYSLSLRLWFPTLLNQVRFFHCAAKCSSFCTALPAELQMLPHFLWDRNLQIDQLPLLIKHVNINHHEGLQLYAHAAYLSVRASLYPLLIMHTFHTWTCVGNSLWMKSLKGSRFVDIRSEVGSVSVFLLPWRKF